MSNFLKTENEIKAWLEHYKIQNYILIPDNTYGFVVNVEGEVRLLYSKLTHIPVKFNEVKGDFIVYHNQLTTLEFCPTTVGGSFDCSHNQLTSLEGAPQIIIGSFSCLSNQLNSLQFFPNHVGGNFSCFNNPALNSAQYITDFKEILINIEKEKLSAQLNKINPNNLSKKITLKV